jgi:hypothetical protein
VQRGYLQLRFPFLSYEASTASSLIRLILYSGLKIDRESMDFYSDPNAGTKVDWSKQDVKEVSIKMLQRQMDACLANSTALVASEKTYNSKPYPSLPWCRRCIRTYFNTASAEAGCVYYVRVSLMVRPTGQIRRQ